MEITIAPAGGDIQANIRESMNMLEQHFQRLNEQVGTDMGSMREADLDALLLEKLRREERRRAVPLAAHIAKQEGKGSTSSSSHDEPKHYDVAEEELQKAGMQLWTQKQVKETVGTERHGWTTALQG